MSEDADRFRDEWYRTDLPAMQRLACFLQPGSENEPLPNLPTLVDEAIAEITRLRKVRRPNPTIIQGGRLDGRVIGELTPTELMDSNDCGPLTRAERVAFAAFALALAAVILVGGWLLRGN